jgi:phosphoserine aminotransferase
VLIFCVMAERIYNFSAGPGTLPLSVLEKARDEMLSLGGTGMSVMELSHRSQHFATILEAAEAGIRELLGVPAGYHVLFLQGGASLQFAMVPMNFMPATGSADHVVTGAWGAKAAAEARRAGRINLVFDGSAEGYRGVPEEGSLMPSRDAAYLHYTSNETIEGVEFPYEIDAAVPVVCDASSNILSRRIDVEKYSLIYAGAQKNIGPSGVTLVIISDDMLGRAPANQFAMLDYRSFARNASMPNTPNTWGIYLVSLVCEWLKGEGGVDAIERRNIEKARIVYDAIDSGDGFYTGHAERGCRSRMNITFRLPNEELDARFCSEAAPAGMDGLAGHRSVGGIRASVYNAFPVEGCRVLADFMREFAARNG